MARKARPLRQEFSLPIRSVCWVKRYQIAFESDATRLRSPTAQGQARRRFDFRRAAVWRTLVWRAKCDQQRSWLREILQPLTCNADSRVRRSRQHCSNRGTRWGVSGAGTLNDQTQLALAGAVAERGLSLDELPSHHFAVYRQRDYLFCLRSRIHRVASATWTATCISFGQ